MARTISNHWTKTKLSGQNWCKVMGHGPYVKASDGEFCANCLKDREVIEEEERKKEECLSGPSTTHN